MASQRLFWMLLAAVATVLAADVDYSDGAPETTTLLNNLPNDTNEILPTTPTGCLSHELNPDCFSASDITAAVVGTFFLTLALVLILYALHRLCWRVYNVKLANYAI